MHEIIQQVLASELQGKTLLAEATNEAQRLVSQAQARAQDLVTQARQTAQREGEDMVAAAVKAAEREKQQQLAGMADQFQTAIRLAPEVTQRAVEAAVGCICGELPASSRGTSVTPEPSATAIRSDQSKQLIRLEPAPAPKFSTPPIGSG